MSELNDVRKTIDDLRKHIIEPITFLDFYNKLCDFKHIFSKDLSFTDRLKILIDIQLNMFPVCKTSFSYMMKMSTEIINYITIYILLKQNKIDNINDQNKVEQAFNEKINELFDHILEKNRKYGNSALSPIRIMSNADEIEQLFVRVDDKLNRMINRQNDDDEDLPFDIIGYFVLIYVCCKMKNDK